jgi:hypothetical protein
MHNKEEGRAKAIKLMAANPKLTLAEVSEKTGLSRPAVSRIRQEFIQPGRKIRGDRFKPLDEALPEAINARPQLRHWLIQSCPPSVPMSEYIASILVDAMLDDQEKRSKSKKSLTQTKGDV